MLRPGGTATIIGMVPLRHQDRATWLRFPAGTEDPGLLDGVENHFRVDMPRLLKLWQQGRLHLDHLITGTLQLSEINEGFARLKGGHVVRQLIAFG